MEDVVAVFEISVGLTVLNVRSVAADTCFDRFAVFRAYANFARQRKQRDRALKLHVLGGNTFRQAGALRFFSIFAFAQLQVGSKPTAANGNVESSRRVFAELAVGTFAGTAGEGGGVLAIRIVRAANEGAELGKLQ